MTTTEQVDALVEEIAREFGFDVLPKRFSGEDSGLSEYTHDDFEDALVDISEYTH